MKFNTRLIIIFLAVILLPFLLATVTFFVICGSMVWNLKHTYGVKDVPLSAALSPAELYSSVTDKYMDILKEKLITEPDFYKNVEEIREIDNQLGRMSSFIIVKGEDKIYYIRPEYEEDEVLDVLPASGILPPEETASLYYNDIHRVGEADGLRGSGRNDRNHLCRNLCEHDCFRRDRNRCYYLHGCRAVTDCHSAYFVAQSGHYKTDDFLKKRHDAY